MNVFQTNKNHGFKPACSYISAYFLPQISQRCYDGPECMLQIYLSVGTNTVQQNSGRVLPYDRTLLPC
jgi:hypothetical protein